MNVLVLTTVLCLRHVQTLKVDFIAPATLGTLEMDLLVAVIAIHKPPTHTTKCSTILNAECKFLMVATVALTHLDTLEMIFTALMYSISLKI